MQRRSFIGGVVAASALLPIVPSWAQAQARQFVETFKDFPPRQKPSSFSVDEVMATMSRSQGG